MRTVEPEVDEGELDVVDLCVGFGLLIIIPAITYVVLGAVGFHVGGPKETVEERLARQASMKTKYETKIPLTVGEYNDRVEWAERVVDENMTRLFASMRSAEDLVEKSEWAEATRRCADDIIEAMAEALIAFDESGILNKKSQLRQRAMAVKRRAEQMKQQADAEDPVRQLQNR